MSAKSHFTTRRGFIAACGFGIVGLYGVWAGYGAAPLLFIGGHEEGGDAHGGYGASADSPSGGHGAATALTPEEFRRLAEDFAARHALGAPSAHAGHGAVHAVSGENDDVYLMAYQWGFTPDALRLESGRTYRLRMMAVDVSHGAAIRLGPGSRIVRLRANTLVEQTTTFTRPGDYLVYCTVYCGPGHARMQSRLIVT
jgi:heme/copper-type cytochrome/quinol oxidase subunit 2